jgi:hypothetical protein
MNGKMVVVAKRLAAAKAVRNRPVTRADLTQKLRRIRDKDPEAFEALMVLIRRVVEK